jgi:prepilin-type N-terminal cleavage/methylation domain-containing protein
MGQRATGGAVLETAGQTGVLTEAFMRPQRKNFTPRCTGCPAFTLVEVTVALAISALLFAGVVLGFVQSAQRAEWSAYNLAAHSLAMQGVEQARAATWDPAAPTPIDNCRPANFPPVGTNMLDVPVAGTNITYATNTWTITTISTNPYPLKMIRVDCTWTFIKSGVRSAVFTNTVATLRAPNQ